jgi:transcriptional regulator with XRE-family HTH domain
MTTAHQRFGTWIVGERERSGLSLREVAKRAGVTHAQYHRMESGLRTHALGNRETVNRIALAVGADPAVARLVAGLDELTPKAMQHAARWQTLDERHQEAVDALTRALMEQERARDKGEA